MYYIYHETNRDYAKIKYSLNGTEFSSNFTAETQTELNLNLIIFTTINPKKNV